MFGKKQACSRCGKKSDKKYDFCPYCGFTLKEKEDFFEPSFKMGFPFNTIFKQLEKQIEKQLQEVDSELPTFMDEEKEIKKNPFMQGISISISSSDKGQPVIRVNQMGNGKTENFSHNNANAQKPKSLKRPKKKITPEQADHYSKLPKEEPLTNVRRLTDKIVYEINLPGVEEKNMIITRLQNSIEIKAFTKNKAFFKLIPISLPILKSQLKEGKLILELKPEI